MVTICSQINKYNCVHLDVSSPYLKCEEHEKARSVLPSTHTYLNRRHKSRRPQETVGVKRKKLESFRQDKLSWLRGGSTVLSVTCQTVANSL